MNNKQFYGFYRASENSMSPEKMTYDWVTFGIYHIDGSCLAEMSMEWKEIKRPIAPYLEIGTNAFRLFGDVKMVATLSNMAQLPEKVTATEFGDFLQSQGFKNQKR